MRCTRMSMRSGTQRITPERGNCAQFARHRLDAAVRTRCGRRTASHYARNAIVRTETTMTRLRHNNLNYWIALLLLHS